jgi:hypothetical protein
MRTPRRSGIEKTRKQPETKRFAPVAERKNVRLYAVVQYRLGIIPQRDTKNFRPRLNCEIFRTSETNDETKR